MRIEFDPAKDASNQANTAFPALVAELDWDAALVWSDDRVEYGELRLIALAPRTGILYYVAYVERSNARRIVSLRRANHPEIKHYVQNS